MIARWPWGGTAREVEAALPHFQRAVAIGRVLELKEALAGSLVRAFDGIAAAEGLLATGDPLITRQNRLHLHSHEAALALAAAIRVPEVGEVAMGWRGFGIPAPRRTGEACVMHMLRMQRGAVRPFLAPEVAAAIFVAPALPALVPKILAALFDLTPA